MCFSFLLNKGRIFRFSRMNFNIYNWVSTPERSGLHLLIIMDLFQLIIITRNNLFQIKCQIIVKNNSLLWLSVYSTGENGNINSGRHLSSHFWAYLQVFSGTKALKLNRRNSKSGLLIKNVV